MKKLLLAIAALSVMTTVSATEVGGDNQLVFTELPFAEGRLFVSVTCGEQQLIANAIEVDGDVVSMPVDVEKYVGKELTVQAFQDLNDNNTLDFDAYGRPTEPCLQTTVSPVAGQSQIQLQLMQY